MYRDWWYNCWLGFVQKVQKIIFNSKLAENLDSKWFRNLIIKYCSKIENHWKIFKKEWTKSPNLSWHLLGWIFPYITSFIPKKFYVSINFIFYGKSLYFPFFTLLNWWHVKNLWSSSDHQLNFLMAIFWRIFISTERKTTSWLRKKKIFFPKQYFLISPYFYSYLLGCDVLASERKTSKKNFFVQKKNQTEKKTWISFMS